MFLANKDYHQFGLNQKGIGYIVPILIDLILDSMSAILMKKPSFSYKEWL